MYVPPWKTLWTYKLYPGNQTADAVVQVHPVVESLKRPPGAQAEIRLVQGEGAIRHRRRTPFYFPRFERILPHVTKNEWRKTLRARRNELNETQQANAARALSDQAGHLRRFVAARRVGLYLPNDGEIDPIALMHRAWAMGKQCFLPVVSHIDWERLWFAPVTANSRYVVNRFGIPEPDTHPREWVRAQHLDFIGMPLVGFDLKGNRLGMGGGFYDRSLAFLRQRHHWQHPHVIGFAHACQQAEVLPADPWDIPMHAIVTDTAVHQLKG